MPVILEKNWWSLVIRGITAIALGTIAFVLPGMQMATLVAVFSGYLFIDALLSLAGGVRASEEHQRWVELIAEGIVDFVTAVVLLAWSNISLFDIIYAIAAWALVTGVFEIASGMRLRKHVEGEWLLGLSGIASLMLGILIISLPLGGPSPIVFWIGVYGFAFGALLVALGFRLRSHTRPRPTLEVPNL